MPPKIGFFKRVMNPLTHAADLEKIRQEYESSYQSFTRAQNNLNNLIYTVQEHMELLYKERKRTVTRLQELQSVVSKIQNCPESIVHSCDKALFFANGIKEAWDWENEQLNRKDVKNPDLSTNSKTASIIGATGALGGGAIAALGPSALISFVTTFGTASTGAAIASLSGAAATNAALAAIGGGAIAAGGAGVAGGAMILSLFGPIGAAVAGITVLGTTIFSRSTNNKKIDEIKYEMERVLNAIQALRRQDSELKKLDKFLTTMSSMTETLNQLISPKSFAEWNNDYDAPSFPREELFFITGKAKLLSKMTQEEPIIL